jgi:hypothetical protein
MQHKKSKGEQWCKDAPYGFAWADGRLVACPAEQAVVAKVKKLRSDGKSLRMIARALNEEGLRNRRGSVFPETQVRRILAQSAMPHLAEAEDLSIARVPARV